MRFSRCQDTSDKLTNKSFTERIPCSRGCFGWNTSVHVSETRHRRGARLVRALGEPDACVLQQLLGASKQGGRNKQPAPYKGGGTRRCFLRCLFFTVCFVLCFKPSRAFSTNSHTKYHAIRNSSHDFIKIELNHVAKLFAISETQPFLRRAGHC